MADAMVTARMPQSKKDAGNEILRELGFSASAAINALYDRVLETREWPIPEMRSAHVDPIALRDALALVDGIARVSPTEAPPMDADAAKRRRLISKGRASEADFA